MKVFGIGLSKTGTRSLYRGLEILGYKSCHWPKSIEEIDSHEASVAMTVASKFKELDNLYPGSKFIFTIRDMAEWLPAIVWNYRVHLRRNRFSEGEWSFIMEAERKIYGEGMGNEITARELEEGYRRHSEDVMAYFRGRGDLLVFDVKQGWNSLCEFLGKEVPAEPFPHKNQRTAAQRLLTYQDPHK